MKQPVHLAATTVLCLLLGACAGSEPTGPDDNSNNTGGRQPIADPSFSQVIQGLFESRSCTASNCHGSGQSAGLDLREGNSYASLVNVPAQGEEDRIRVIPGNANDSYIVIKVEGRQSVGSRMPVGGALDAVDITNIRNWINQGAKNN